MFASNPSEFICLVPSTIEEALEQKATQPDLSPIAGGTEVMVLFNEGLITQRRFQSLHRLARDWRYIRSRDGGGLAIGALATYSDLRRSAAVAMEYPLLIEAAKVTGALQIQNRGTLVGNVVNGSPAADSVPSLLVYDAELRLVSASGERLVPLSAFYTGYRKTLLRPDELVAEILLPPSRFGGGLQYYNKVGTRAAQAISKVVLAAARSGRTVRISVGSVAPTPLRAPKTEVAIASGASAAQAWEVLRGEIGPIDDIRSTREYRLAVTRNVLADFLGRKA